MYFLAFHLVDAKEICDYSVSHLDICALNFSLPSFCYQPNKSSLNRLLIAVTCQTDFETSTESWHAVKPIYVCTMCTVKNDRVST